MNEHLQQRFDMLLELAKDPKNSITAAEVLAAARELIDTALTLNHISVVDFRAYHCQVATAQRIVSLETHNRLQKMIQKSRDSLERGVS